MIAYVKHPVSAEEKAQIRKQGYRIVDAKFAPKGAPIYGKETVEETQAEEVKPKRRGRPKKAASE